MGSECLKTLLKQGATRPFRGVTASADTLFRIRDEHNTELNRLCAERDEFLRGVKLAYRKHWLNDESIGWDELGNTLHVMLCNALGDDGYIEWQESLEEEGWEVKD